MLSRKKTNSNCCTAALAVYLRTLVMSVMLRHIKNSRTIIIYYYYLLLFNASYYRYSPSTASGAHYRSACIDMDMLRLAAAACCDMG